MKSRRLPLAYRARPLSLALRSLGHSHLAGWLLPRSSLALNEQRNPGPRFGRCWRARTQRYTKASCPSVPSFVPSSFVLPLSPCLHSPPPSAGPLVHPLLPPNPAARARPTSHRTAPQRTVRTHTHTHPGCSCANSFSFFAIKPSLVGKLLLALRLKTLPLSLTYQYKKTGPPIYAFEGLR
ncbi:hypothetical protein BDZ88DRAFT_281461 [Geranomyces variabilis]|nr:hypothetical protein BDZ88DRAFT_281461 [Geranomyces variabilis]